MPRSKKKKGKKAQAAFLSDSVDDELVALQAIYGSAFTLDGDERGFCVEILPHPAEAETNRVAVELCCRCR